MNDHYYDMIVSYLPPKETQVFVGHKEEDDLFAFVCKHNSTCREHLFSVLCM